MSSSSPAGAAAAAAADRYQEPRDEAKLASLVSEALAYAVANGMLMAAPPVAAAAAAAGAPLYKHAPFALLPNAFPAREYVKVRALAPVFNALVERVAADGAWLKAVLADVVLHDDFTRRLVEIYEAIDGSGRAVQPVHLGIHRSDYMLHGPSLAEARILQVEINTIASSFGCLSSRATALHRYLTEKVLGLGPTSPSSPSPSTYLPLLPDNDALGGIAHGLAMAHREYLLQEEQLRRQGAYGGNKEEGRRRRMPTPSVLMVVQPGERNVMDQKLLEIALWERYGIPLRRATLAEVAVHGRLDLDRRQNLLLKAPKASSSSSSEAAGAAADAGGSPSGAAAAPTVWKGSDGGAPPVVAKEGKEEEEEGREVEVTVAYFRAGYTPADYPGEEEWRGRELVEMSSAIKCPCVSYHLAGTKKVQEALSRPGALERFLPDPGECALARGCFAGLYGLEPGNPQADAAVAEALRRPGDFVLKPQREGGGNNLYDDELVAALRGMNAEERAAFILMEKIRPPGMEAYFVRDGRVQRGAAVYELGVYGVFLGQQADRPLVNESVGHLLRTKLASSNEGGVAAGFAVLSSPLLVASPPSSSSGEGDGQDQVDEEDLLRYCLPATAARRAARRRWLRALAAALALGAAVAVGLAHRRQRRRG